MEKVTFEDHAKELFRTRCGACHNPNKKSGGLDLTNFTGVMQGGSSGAVVEAGNADGSYLYRLVAHLDEPNMPPDVDRIPDAELALLKGWIEGGALENKASTAKIKARKKMDVVTDPAAGRPAVIATPAKLVLEPQVVALRETAVTAMATSPWAPLVALASNHQVVLYDTSNLQIRGILPFPEGEIRVLKFSRNGSLLLAGGGRSAASGRVVLFNVVSGQRIAELGDELDCVLAADIDARHTLVALGGPQKMIRVYAVATGDLVFETKKHTDWITAMEFSPDGVLLATGDRNGGLYVWEAMTGREYLTLKAHTARVSAVTWRADSNVLASASEDTTLRLWELENGAEIKGWAAHAGGVTGAEFLRDGRLASVGRDRVPRVWDQNGAQQLALEATADVTVAVTACDEVNRLIVGDWTGEVRVYNLADATRTGSLSTNPPALATRLEQSTQRVMQTEGELAPLLLAARLAEQRVAEAQQAWQAAQQSMQTIQSQLADQQLQLQRIGTEQMQVRGRVEMLRERIGTLTGTLPLLREAVQKTDTAAQQAAADEPLQQLASQSRTLLSQQETELTQRQQDLSATEQQQGQLAESARVTQVAIDAFQKQLQLADDAARQIAGIQPPLVDQLSAAQAACDSKTRELDAARGEAQRWNDAIQFARQYLALREQLAAADSERVMRLTEVTEAEVLMRNATEQLSAKQQAAAQVEQKIGDIEAQLSVLQGTSQP